MQYLSLPEKLRDTKGYIYIHTRVYVCVYVVVNKASVLVDLYKKKKVYLFNCIE